MIPDNASAIHWCVGNALDLFIIIGITGELREMLNTLQHFVPLCTDERTEERQTYVYLQLI